jgi:hypothetical protein
MKKILLVLLTIITLGVNAQTLVDTNKVWNVVACLNFGPCGTTVFSFGADTTIGAFQYKKIIVNRDSAGFGYSYPIAAREDTVTKQIYFYENGEYLAYDFSLNQGDTFITSLNGCNLQMIVDSVDTISLLNGEMRKRMFLSNNGQEIWIEGVGSLFGLTFVGGCTIDVYPTLNCFKENDTLKYQNSNFTDCFYNTVGIQEIHDINNYRVTPNPFTESTVLSFENPLHEINILKIFNIQGQLIRENSNIKGNEIKIDREMMNDGIYFFQIMNERRIVATGNLIVN